MAEKHEKKLADRRLLREKDNLTTGREHTFSLLLNRQKVPVLSGQLDHLHAKCSSQLLLGPSKHLLKLPAVDTKDSFFDAVSADRCSGVFASEGISHQLLDELACLVSLDTVHVVHLRISVVRGAVEALMDVFVFIGFSGL